MTDGTSPKRRRRRGSMSPREIMHAKRALPPEIDPCPVGPVGGQYKPLTDGQLEQIYQNALRILSELGIGEAPPLRGVVLVENPAGVLIGVDEGQHVVLRD